MFTHQVFQDFKENAKSAAHIKTSGLSRKGLASRNLNSFTESSELLMNKKKNSEMNNCQFFSKEKDTKQKLNLREKKIDLHAAADDKWSDIEEMHICNEPDDDYEDIFPQCERIQKVDIDALFFDYTFTNYTELTVDKLPSPLKEESFNIPEFFPSLPNFEVPLFDDSELGFIPLSNNLLIK